MTPARIGSLLAFLLCAAILHAQEQTVDFRYSPSRHYTAICLPYDWLKTVVTPGGGLGYDFGPGGPYAVPLTEITFGVQDTLLPVTRQYFADSRAPIAITELGNGALRFQQHAFALVPELFEIPSSAYDDGTVRRLHGIAGGAGWAAPIVPADPAFRNVAWGTIRPVQYRVRVAAGASKTVALGICEGGKNKGSRLFDLRVEGAALRTIDPVEEGRKNQPYVFLFAAEDVNRDGELAIEVHASPNSPDPNVYLNAFWIFPAQTNPDPQAILRGELSAQAEVYFDCGRELEAQQPRPRVDALLADFDSGDRTALIAIHTPRALTYDAAAGMLRSEGRPYLISRPAAISATHKDKQWLLELPRGTRHAELIVLHGPVPGAATPAFPDLEAARRRSATWWPSTDLIPFGKIKLADAGLQYVLEANLRNQYQVAEIIDGRPQFQPGPSVYRGLFTFDILLMGEPLATLGDTATVRRFIESVLPYQQPNGQIRVMQPHPQLSETALLVYTLVWHAQLTNNREWLARHFDKIEKGMAWLQAARAQTLGDPTAKNHGLMPGGFLDGGISGTISDFSSVMFAFLGLEKAIAAARWLDQPQQAEAWQRLLDEFMASFQAAARRDLRRDRLGNLYLPVTVADTATTAPPQRGQWGLLVPLRYGRCFQARGTFLDSVITANLNLLQHTLQQGLVVDTGWLKNGVWSWFGGMHALTLIWRRDYAGAHAMMYALANHANPLGVWVEEQHLRSAGTGTTGDISNAEASAYFVNLALHLLMYERENQVELLAGVPPEWYRAGAHLALREALTSFGTVSVGVEISPAGNTGAVQVASRRGPQAGDLILTLHGLQQQGFRDSRGKPLPAIMKIPWGKPVRIALRKP